MSEESSRKSSEEPPIWLDADLVVAIHDRQLRRFGGPPGMRDANALDSALGRPRNRFAYEGADLPELAAACAFGIARNHPFVDGNKRTALLALVTFLGLNGTDFVVSQEQAVLMIQGLAAGEIDEAALTRWIRDGRPV